MYDKNAIIEYIEKLVFKDKAVISSFLDKISTLNEKDPIEKSIIAGYNNNVNTIKRKITEMEFIIEMLTKMNMK